MLPRRILLTAPIQRLIPPNFDALPSTSASSKPILGMLPAPLRPGCGDPGQCDIPAVVEEAAEEEKDAEVSAYWQHHQHERQHHLKVLSISQKIDSRQITPTANPSPTSIYFGLPPGYCPIAKARTSEEGCGRLEWGLQWGGV
jgi:hypothetical protein